MKSEELNLKCFSILDIYIFYLNVLNISMVTTKRGGLHSISCISYSVFIKAMATYIQASDAIFPSEKEKKLSTP